MYCLKMVVLENVLLLKKSIFASNHVRDTMREYIPTYSINFNIITNPNAISCHITSTLRTQRQKAS